MATRDIVTLNEIASRLEVPQVGDTYNLPRDVTAPTVSVDKLNVGANTASATGRIKADAIEFSDGTVALTGTVVTGSQNIDSVLGLGNTTTKEMVAGRFGIAAIDYVLPIPAANIVAHDFFDNTQDAAWIDQCADKSWENEPRSTGKQYLAANYANDAAALAANPAIVNGDVYYTGSVFNEYGVGVTTRAGSRKFAMRGFVTAEAARVIIWDITSGSPEMWMVVNNSSADGWMYPSHIASSVKFLGGVLLIGVSSGFGVLKANFISDDLDQLHSSGYIRMVASKVSQRQSGSTGRQLVYLTTAQQLVNNAVNSVAITYLPDAPLDDYGMRVPTIMANTAGGVSFINNDGTVANVTGANASYDTSDTGFFLPDNSAVFSMDVTGFQRFVYQIAIPTASRTVSNTVTGNTDLLSFPANTVGGDTIAPSPTADVATIKSSRTQYGVLLVTDVLAVIRNNPTTPANGMVAYLTNTYNTGWMVGDIRRAFLCNSLTADRSVKGGTLTMTGTVTETVNAGGVNVYSGFSATNYLSEAHSADYGFGVGDFAIMLWHKNVSSGTTQRIVDIADTSYTGSYIILYIVGSGSYTIAFRDIVGGTQTLAHTVTPSSVNFDFIVAGRRGGISFISVNGIEVSGAASSGDLTNINNIIRIGVQLNGASPLTGGQVAQVRISATAPTAEQIKHMYETERKLFEPNTQALLPHSTSPAVVDLKPDPKSGMYVVENGAAAKGSSSNFTAVFKDLVRVDSAATGSTIATPLTTLSGNRVLAPAVDIGSELAAQVKPDKHSVMVYYTGTASLEYRAPMGMKITSAVAITTGVHVDLSLAANDKFDGFIHSTVVANGTKYQITLEAV